MAGENDFNVDLNSFLKALNFIEFFKTFINRHILLNIIKWI